MSRGRRADRTDATSRAIPKPPGRLRDCHLLLLPSTVTISELGTLISARIPSADLVGNGFVALGRHSRLTGPYELSMEEAVDAAVPMPWTLAYALQAPLEREDPPLPGADDRDGFAFAFPYGLPWREEGRGLHLLVALARRLEGVVRVTGGEIIAPDPGRAVDHLVHSPYWLDPEILLRVIARVSPGARLATEGVEWTGPPREAYTGELVLADIAQDPLDGDQLAWLHALADDVDVSRLSQDDEIDAVAVRAPLGSDGAVEVLAQVREQAPAAVARQPWADQPVVTYEIRWRCANPVERESRTPEHSFVRSRKRAKPIVSALARAVVEAAGGVVTDEDGFWVDRYAL